jgi:citrate lyase subunit beta/citryl-CoA lyase
MTPKSRRCAEPGVPIVLPKAESAAELAEMSTRLGGQARIIALVETAKGVHAVDTVSRGAGVTRLALGNVDLSTELGVDPASLRHSRMPGAASWLPPPARGYPRRSTA